MEKIKSDKMNDDKMKDKKAKMKVKEKSPNWVREYGELFAEVLVFVFFINAFLLQTYVIPSASMETTMLIGDHLLVDKVKYSAHVGLMDEYMLPQTEMKRGMIVTFFGPREIVRGEEPRNLVKRLIALPGDTIRIHDEKVFINGKLTNEPYTIFRSRKPHDRFPPENPFNWPYEFPREFRNNVVDTPQGKVFRVPDGHYFCMGDNRNNSSDSRMWGPVPEEYIIGCPWRVYWSYEGTAKDYAVTGAKNKAKDLFKTIGNFFSKTRWKRTFKKY